MEIKEKVKKYVLESTLVSTQDIRDDSSIFEAGLLDSMGLLFLIEFINETFGVEVNDKDLNPQNFDTINSITLFVESKLK